MTAGAFAATLVAGVLALSPIPVWVARTRRTLYGWDIALLLLPTVTFCVVGDVLNPELQMGFGLVAYPFLTFVASLAILYARIFWLDRVTRRSFRNSVICLALACMIAILSALLVPSLDA